MPELLDFRSILGLATVVVAVAVVAFSSLHYGSRKGFFLAVVNISMRTGLGRCNNGSYTWNLRRVEAGVGAEGPVSTESTRGTVRTTCHDNPPRGHDVRKIVS
eukprot:176710-Amorphochlora_amoeboformis.AAC.1